MKNNFFIINKKAKMRTIHLDKDDYQQINGTTWKCKYTYDPFPQWINLRCGGNKKDYWGFCDSDGDDWKVEWVN
jgi:hypothetical protein